MYPCTTYIYIYVSLIYISFICVYIDINMHAPIHTNTPRNTKHRTYTHTYRNILNYAELKSKNIIKKSLSGLKIELKNYSKCL